MNDKRMINEILEDAYKEIRDNHGMVVKSVEFNSYKSSSSIVDEYILDSIEIGEAKLNRSKK